MDPRNIEKLKIQQGERPVRRPRRIVRNVVLVLLLAGIVAGGAWLYRTGALSPSVEVKQVSVTWVYPSQTVTLFNASGYVVAQTKAAVASKGTGRLVYLGVREGESVKKGHVLARLDNDDLKAERAQIKAQLVAARHELERARIESGTADRNYRRMEDLWKRRAVAQLDYENAEDRALKARAAIDVAQANVAALVANEERLDVLIEYTIIRAPFDGVVLTKDADVGEVVAPFGSATNAKAAVVTMADMSSLLVEADVSESFLSKVRIGEPCEIQLDAIPDTRFRGRVDAIVPTADRSKGTVQVKVAFDALDPRILPEMSARVAFLSRELGKDEMQPFLAVHRETLVERGGEKGVFVIEGDHVRWLPIPDAHLLGDFVPAAAVLEEGQRVVINPPASLEDGDRVKIAE